MGKMGSSLISSFNFSSHSRSVALFASLYSLCFLLISANVSGFDSLLQLLPPSASLRSKSETLFRVNDYGAAGDGITDDTNVSPLLFICIHYDYVASSFVMLWGLLWMMNFSLCYSWFCYLRAGEKYFIYLFIHRGSLICQLVVFYGI